MYVEYLLALALLLVATVNGETTQGGCTTPDSKKGVCINLPDCPKINSMSNDFETPMTLERLQFLIKSSCGFANGMPKVCCPVFEEDLIIKELTLNYL